MTTVVEQSWSPFRAENIGNLEGMGETGQLHRIAEKLDADEAATPRQIELGGAAPMIKGQMGGGLRGVCAGLQHPRVGADGKGKAGTEGVGRAQQIAEIHRL